MLSLRAEKPSVPENYAGTLASSIDKSVYIITSLTIFCLQSLAKLASPLSKQLKNLSPAYAGPYKRV